MKAQGQWAFSTLSFPRPFSCDEFLIWSGPFCNSAVPGGFCKLIGAQCWCFASSETSGAAVCGYGADYTGRYYSISEEGAHKPHKIIRDLGKNPSSQWCAEDTNAGCSGSTTVNKCSGNNCWGTSLRSVGTDDQRKTTWQTSNTASIVRCKNLEGMKYSMVYYIYL